MKMKTGEEAVRRFPGFGDRASGFMCQCPSINEIRGTGEFPIRKCEFLRKAKEIKGL